MEYIVGPRVLYRYQKTCEERHRGIRVMSKGYKRAQRWQKRSVDLKQLPLSHLALKKSGKHMLLGHLFELAGTENKLRTF